MRQTMLLVGCKNPEAVTGIDDLDCTIEITDSSYVFCRGLRRVRFIFPCYIPSESRDPLIRSIFDRLASVGAFPERAEWSFVGTTADVLVAFGEALDRKIDRRQDER